MSDGFRRRPVVPSGARGRREAAGLGASPDGGHEEVDGSAGQERAGILGAAAPHDEHRGEDGALPARRRARLHQPAQQGEGLNVHSAAATSERESWKRRRTQKVLKTEPTLKTQWRHL